jgi:hypothetical protein
VRNRKRLVQLVIALSALAACSGVKVSDRKILVDEKLPRPHHIYVYDFVATPADVPSDSQLAGHPALAKQPPQTAKQIALGREIGADLAKQLVAEIAAMGLPAQEMTGQPALELSDLAIHGTLLTVDPGSATERVAIGFGEGAAELKVAVEGYYMTDHGLQKVGSGTLDTSANETPGAAVPLAVAVASGNPIGLIVSTGVKVYGEESGSSTIHGKVKDIIAEVAKLIRPRFEQEGWIPPVASAH